MGNAFFPVILMEVYIFSLGLGLFLAEAAVFFRDIQYIYNVLTTAWMYLTPIFYPMEQLPESVQKAIKILILCISISHSSVRYHFIRHYRLQEMWYTDLR